jgi:hypothetical protein
MSADPATLKPGDRIRNGTGLQATVLAVDGVDIFARYVFGSAFVATAEFWDLVPPPPLIDPEQVWCLPPLSGAIYRYSSATGWPRFRITQIEEVE